ncbi:MAG: DUF4168 domain-containing protein [Halomonadaceae bacterium]|nr:MAG: DUF4168 domain-containing protein [Halomonadaceae bacterium]
MTLKTTASALSLTFAMGLAAAPALAQEYGGGEGQQQQQDQQQQQQDMGQPEQQQQADFSDEELMKFVELQDKIGEVRDDYVSRIEGADSEDQARELQQEAQTEMVQVIEEAGMDVQEYNAIAVAYNSDPSIQERVDELSSS